MPAMLDSRFARAVIYMCAHSPDGAMGIIINQRAPNIDFNELLEQLNIVPSEERISLPNSLHAMAVHLGGPVETGRGFVLHSADYFKAESTLPIDEAVCLTATVDILRDIAKGSGPDKALLALGGRTILDHVIERARPQVSALALNANGDPARFGRFGLPVIADVGEGHAGPLAGVLTGLEWAAAEMPDCAWVATFASDAPFLAPDLVARLREAVERDGADMACASSAGRHHPVFGLWPVALAGALRHAVIDEAIRKVDVWTARYGLAVADFAAAPLDPFFNANRPDDLVEAEALLTRLEATSARDTDG